MAHLVENPPRIPDIGLGYLAKHLGQDGREVRVLDWNMEPSEAAFRRTLQEFQPEVVGLKFFTKDARAARETAEVVKDELPGCVLVAGGPHPSCVEPEELLEAFPRLDYGLRGEAESALPALADAVAAERAGESRAQGWQEDIPGLVWRGEQGVRANPPQFEPELDALDGPAWEAIDPANYLGDMCFPPTLEGPAAPICTTRGCPGQCSFCSAHLVNGRRIRYRTPARVVDEMERLGRQFGVRKFMITDNCFTSRRSHFVAVCNEILERGLTVEWDCCTYERLDHIDDETAALLRRSGCRMVHMGIESGHPEVRRTMRKHCDVAGYKRIIPILRRHGILVGGWFILGFPGETLEQMRETIRQAFALRPDFLSFTPCFPLPGSPVYEALRAKHGVDRVDWAEFHIKDSAYPAHALSTDQLNALFRKVRFLERVHRRWPAAARALATALFGRPRHLQEMGQEAPAC
jgi:radical SAM superfamily enzyme YgiQ (UPF0313 family)